MSSGPSRPAAHLLSVVLVNERRELGRLGELVDRFGGECRLPADTVLILNLVLDEIVSNVIKYGYDDTLEHEIHVRVVLEGDLLTIQVEDDGRSFNPLEAPPPNLDLPIEQRPIGGLGVFIVKSTVDAAEYRREGGRNVLTIKKRTSAR